MPSLRTLLPLCLLISSVLPNAAPAAAAPVDSGRKVLLVTFDGMRPDFVSEANTPNLAALKNEGVFFARHHPVFLSSTEVNGTAISTGTYPAHSGLMANVEYRPAVDPLLPMETQNLEKVRKGDEAAAGQYLKVPTIAEILRSHRVATVIAGTKDVSLLLDRSVRDAGPGVSPSLFLGLTLPETVLAPIVSELGEYPPAGGDENKLARDVWTTRALVGNLWRDGVPAFTHLWLGEPDATQHWYGPGSPEALAAIRAADRNLGLVLAELDRRGLRGATDILVVSDHGFSTVGRKVDVAAELTKLKFDAARELKEPLKKGAVLVVSNGGSTLLYVGGHDVDVSAKLVTALQAQNWTGVIFARSAAEGTFPLSEALIDTADAPDIVVSLRWDDGVSANGTRGMQISDLAETSTRKGNHASLSPFDMRNTLVAAGPDFRAGVIDSLPSGNTDIAPTVLWILGFRDDAQYMDGRVLGEALKSGGPAFRTLEMKRLTASHGIWRQYLEVTELNGVRYLDEGNGGLVER